VGFTRNLAPISLSRCSEKFGNLGKLNETFFIIAPGVGRYLSHKIFRIYAHGIGRKVI
jgi:hypothetical protein